MHSPRFPERSGNIMTRSSNLLPPWKPALTFVSYYKQVFTHMNTFSSIPWHFIKALETEKHSGSFLSISTLLNTFKETWLCSAKTRQLFLKSFSFFQLTWLGFILAPASRSVQMPTNVTPSCIPTEYFLQWWHVSPPLSLASHPFSQQTLKILGCSVMVL